METREFNLEKQIVSMLSSEPFYAAISRYIAKRKNTRIPTARVFVTESGHFIMEYNPEFFAQLSPAHRLGVLEHEFQHLILGHVTSRCPSPQSEDLQYWNIATDLAINSLLGREKLPTGCLFPGEGIFKELQPNLAAETYLSVVKKKHKEEKNESTDHSGWIAQDGKSEERHNIAEQRCRDILQKAVNECTGSGWGSIPAEMKKQILERLQATIDWRKVLRFFIKASQVSEKTSTIKNINRRYPYIHAGRKVLRHARIAIGIDQSGSVDDLMLSTFFSELESLAKIAEFTVFFFDTEVDENSVQVWKKGKPAKKERTRCGGTCFDAPTAWINAKNFDGCIIMTDMQAPVPRPCKVKRLWVTTEEAINKDYAGMFKERIIAVKTSNKS
jgi:predicted metal-dependent peptidase